MFQKSFINLKCVYLEAIMKVRVGKRGVVVIPKNMRERLGIKEGAFLELNVAGDAPVLRVKDSRVS